MMSMWSWQHWVKNVMRSLGGIVENVFSSLFFYFKKQTSSYFYFYFYFLIIFLKQQHKSNWKVLLGSSQTNQHLGFVDYSNLDIGLHSPKSISIFSIVIQCWIDRNFFKLMIKYVFPNSNYHSSFLYLQFY